MQAFDIGAVVATDTEIRNQMIRDLRFQSAQLSRDGDNRDRIHGVTIPVFAILTGLVALSAISLSPVYSRRRAYNLTPESARQE